MLNLYYFSQSIHDLLAMLSQAETGPEIDKYGTAIVQRLGVSKNSKRRITSEEMRAILQEKDAALIKVSLKKKTKRPHTLPCISMWSHSCHIALHIEPNFWLYPSCQEKIF